MRCSGIAIGSVRDANFPQSCTTNLACYPSCTFQAVKAMFTEATHRSPSGA